jgi:hypothetical protein
MAIQKRSIPIEDLTLGSEVFFEHSIGGRKFWTVTEIEAADNSGDVMIHVSAWDRVKETHQVKRIRKYANSLITVVQ